MPNGGVLIFQVNSIPSKTKSNNITLERLIFLYPQSTLDVEIKTNKDAYEPGDKVSLAIGVDKPQQFNESEFFFASIKVSDLSSFLKVESFKQMPNLQ